VRPYFEHLKRLQRGAQARSVLAKLAFKGLTLQLNGFASLLADSAEPLVGREAGRRAENAKIACAVLKSITGPSLADKP
jgi:hypothetical protein